MVFGFIKKMMNGDNNETNNPSKPPVSADVKKQVATDGLLNLQKNDVLDLTKRNPSLNNVILGAGWDVSRRGANIDVDLVALLLNENGKLVNGNKSVIYYAAKEAQGIFLDGDNLTGDGEGDDERINVSLASLPSGCHKVAFAAIIYQAKERKQNFSMVRNCYVRLLDKDNREKEICRFNLTEDGGMNTGIVFAELSRQGSEWNFKAVGELLETTLRDLSIAYK